MRRTRQHEIETECRRIVTSLLPADRFVEREITERDYGIDLTVECFDNGEPSGLLLLLQLKGTDQTPPSEGVEPHFDIEVSWLLSAERSVIPVLLVWCPVKASPPVFWYLWVQEYIHIVLDYERPAWRNQKKTRLVLPYENRLPEKVGFLRLRHIAGHPARADAFGQLLHQADQAKWKIDDPAQLLLIFEKVVSLDAIFGDRLWMWGQFQHYLVEQGARACRIAISGHEPTYEELASCGISTNEQVLVNAANHIDAEVNEFLLDIKQHMIQARIKSAVNHLSTMGAIYFDYGIKHLEWHIYKHHDF